MKFIKFQLIFLIIIVTSSCLNKRENKLKSELGKIYKNDTICLNYSNFLLINLKYKEHYAGEKYESYISKIPELVNKNNSFEYEITKLDRIKKKHLTPDINTISLNLLAKNIETTYNTFNIVKWKNSVKLWDFQNFILPYKVNMASLENWKDSVLNDYGDTIFNIENIEDATLYLLRMASKSKREFKIRHGLNSLYYPDLPYSMLKLIPVGSCKELSDLTTFILRSYSIPCVQDFTPNYTNIRSGHYWNAIIDENGKTIPFVVPLEFDSLGYFKSEHYHLGKVYRHAFVKNPNNHAGMNNKKNYLPDFFNDEYIYDVTDEYVETHNVSVPILKEMKEKEIVYLSVFNNNTWSPIAWGNIDNYGNAKYNKVGVEGMYIPMSINRFKNIYLNYPFILQKDNNIKVKKPDYDNLINLIVLRKYPLTSKIKRYINSMLGGYFEASENCDFTDAVVLGEITKLNGEYFNEIQLFTDKKYKYVRYVSPSNSYCNIAELEFYNEKNMLLEGEIISTEGINPQFPERTKDLAFDGDILTFFHAKDKDSSWIGLCLNESENITKIRFLPRNANNIIMPGNEYEVFFWDNEWKSLGKKVASGNKVEYYNVPSNALYFIKNHSSGKEERIFTYEDNKQLWW